MKNRKYLLLFSYFLLFTIFGMLFLDLAGVFSYTDLPFLISFFLYFLFLVIQKATSKTSFVIAIFLLVYMGLSYIPTGAGRVTERIGEWFYLFLVVGLIQYTNEAWTQEEPVSRQVDFSMYSKIRYYVLFLYYKVRILTDCRSGRMSLYVAELLHVVNSLFHRSYEMPHHDEVKAIETIFGRYTFIADNYEYSILSPAFERPDIELFIQQMKQTLAQGKKVLFLDIGANVGLYTVGLACRIGKNRFKTYAFEPDPAYYKLLLTNIAENDVTDVSVHNIFLGAEHTTTDAGGFRLDNDTVKKTRVRFQVRSLDSIITPAVFSRFDEIYVKIDIEGNEVNALDGAKKLWKSGKKIHLMIEDCVTPSIVQYLHAHGFRFIKKITPYDSFWELN